MAIPPHTWDLKGKAHRSKSSWTLCHVDG